MSVSPSDLFYESCDAIISIVDGNEHLIGHLIVLV